MTSGESGEAIDASYRTLTDTLPAHLKELAEDLPFRLGIARARGEGWGDFVGLGPNRELPRYAAEDLAVTSPGGVGPSAGDAGDGGLCLPPERMRLFLYAHHVGGFHWLVRDRLEDRQVAAELARDGRLRQLSRLYGARWREALEAATGDDVLVEALVQQAVSRWRRGTRAEQRLPALVEPLSPGRYAAVVRDKLAWIAVPARALILSCGRAARLRLFLRAHDLFLLGLQVVDDVIDRDEDRALRGSDVPSVLRCSPGALLRVAPKLIARSGAVAAAGGFTGLAAWLGAFEGALASWRLEGDALAYELDAIGIAGEMEEAVTGGDGSDGGDDDGGGGDRPRGGRARPQATRRAPPPHAIAAGASPVNPRAFDRRVP